MQATVSRLDYRIRDSRLFLLGIIPELRRDVQIRNWRFMFINFHTPVYNKSNLLKLALN